MLAGYFIYRVTRVPDILVRDLSLLVFRVGLPVVLFFGAVQVDYTRLGTAKYVLAGSLASLAVVACALIYANARGWRGEQRAIFTQGAYRANLGIIKVPDARVEFVSKVFDPKKKTLAEIAFVDVAGPEAKSTESGLDTRITTEMRQVDALVHVVRDFESPLLTRPPDPLRDLDDFESEIVLTDLVQVDSKLDRLRKEGAKGQERTLIEKLHAHLEAGKPLRTCELSASEHALIQGFAFVSIMPCAISRGSSRPSA